jgi:DNA-binding NarL/FixJ family response regulator
MLRMRLSGVHNFIICGEAANGVEAVLKVEHSMPDVAILDFVMPEMNGLEAATAIRLMSPSIRLYLLTCHYSREIELAGADAGVNAVFSKYDGLGPLIRRAKADCAIKESNKETKSASTQNLSNITDEKSRIH